MPAARRSDSRKFACTPAWPGPDRAGPRASRRPWPSAPCRSDGALRVHGETLLDPAHAADDAGRSALVRPRPCARAGRPVGRDEHDDLMAGICRRPSHGVLDRALQCVARRCALRSRDAGPSAETFESRDDAISAYGKRSFASFDVPVSSVQAVCRPNAPQQRISSPSRSAHESSRAREDECFEPRKTDESFED